MWRSPLLWQNLAAMIPEHSKSHGGLLGNLKLKFCLQYEGKVWYRSWSWIGPHTLRLVCAVAMRLLFAKPNQVRVLTRFVKIVTWICQGYKMYLSSGYMYFSQSNSAGSPLEPPGNKLLSSQPAWQSLSQSLLQSLSHGATWGGSFKLQLFSAKSFGTTWISTSAFPVEQQLYLAYVYVQGWQHLWSWLDSR